MDTPRSHLSFYHPADALHNLIKNNERNVSTSQVLGFDAIDRTFLSCRIVRTRQNVYCLRFKESKWETFSLLSTIQFLIEPDLEVILGATLGNEEHVMCHSQILARDSAYVRGKLTSFAASSDSMKIRFPDVTRDVWNKAMKFLEPGGTFDMTIEGMDCVLPFYDQYSFATGVHMCDRTIEVLLNKVGARKGSLF